MAASTKLLRLPLGTCWTSFCTVSGRSVKLDRTTVLPLGLRPAPLRAPPFMEMIDLRLVGSFVGIPLSVLHKTQQLPLDRPESATLSFQYTQRIPPLRFRTACLDQQMCCCRSFMAAFNVSMAMARKMGVTRAAQGNDTTPLPVGWMVQIDGREILIYAAL